RAACDEQQVHIAVTREPPDCRLFDAEWRASQAHGAANGPADRRQVKHKVVLGLFCVNRKAAEPQKVKSFASTVQPGVNSDGEVPSDLILALLVDRSLELPGLEHRPFSDEEIKEAFATFDLDNNRFVGAAEISHILKLIGEEVSHQEIDEMIRMCDTDGDGQVTFDEFYKMMTTPAPPLPPEVRSTKKKPYSTKLGGAKRYAKQLTESGPTSLEKATAELSKNKGDWRAQQNAAAEVSEMGNVRELLLVEQLIHKLSGGMGKIKPSQIKKIYKRFGDIDVDKSGAIDYEEFIQAMDMEDTNIARPAALQMLAKSALSVQEGALLPDYAAGGDAQHSYAIAKNERQRMEDAVAISDNVGGCRWYAVFDGHGGDAWQKYASKRSLTSIHSKMAARRKL
ncbi:unnamed protein product, partial [Symbiodinium microadriaticum]